MTSLRIATFNVLCGDFLTGVGSWSGRLPLLRRSVSAARADVLGLQEVLPSKLADVADLVAPLTLVPGPSTGPPRWFDLSPMIESVARIMRSSDVQPAHGAPGRSERNQAGEHLPIAYRADRFELLDSGSFWISATPDRPASMLPLARTPFLVHWVRLALRGSPGSLLVMNAHFGHAPWHHEPTARIVTAQLQALEAANVGHVDRKRSAASVFLVGDFNAVPSSRLLRSLTSTSGARFVDAARSAAERVGPPVTYHWGRGARRLGLTLDYVLARTSLRAARAEVIDVHDGPLRPSDHHLLALEFGPPNG